MSRRRIASLALSVLLGVSVAFPPNASAVFGGTLAVGDLRVVALTNGMYSANPACSGSLLNSQTVVAAAHCLGNIGMKYVGEEFFPQNLWVAAPGSDLYLDYKDTRVKVVKVLLTNGYDNTFDFKTENIISMKDDIAFYLLEKPLVPKYAIEIASESDIAFIKQNRLLITHIGYGMQNPGMADGKPYLVELKSFTTGSSRYPNNPAYDTNTVASEETGDKALCGGDSGSPWYATIDGVEKLVAVTVGASGCRGPDSGRNGTFGTVIYPYLHLITGHLERSKADKAAVEKVIADLAALEKVALAKAAADKAAADSRKALIDNLETKLIALMKSKPDLKKVILKAQNALNSIKASSSANDDYALKQQLLPIEKQIQVLEKMPTITCVKGKLSKKVTAVKPKCPKGFKKK